MNTVTQTWTIDNSDLALDALADKAYACLGACDGRFSKAVAIVRRGDITLTGEKAGIVASCQGNGAIYHVTCKTCTCPDHAQRGTALCKHILALMLAWRLKKPVEVAAVAPVVSTPAPVALPEAPASVNVRLPLHGREVQVTLRDTCEVRLLARLEALLAQFPRLAA